MRLKRLKSKWVIVRVDDGTMFAVRPFGWWVTSVRTACGFTSESDVAVVYDAFFDKNEDKPEIVVEQRHYCSVCGRQTCMCDDREKY